MTLQQIQERIEQIRDCPDPEIVRASEYELHRDVLRAISQGCRNPSELARAALEARRYFP